LRAARVGSEGASSLEADDETTAREGERAVAVKTKSKLSTVVSPMPVGEPDETTVAKPAASC